MGSAKRAYGKAAEERPAPGVPGRDSVQTLSSPRETAGARVACLAKQQMLVCRHFGAASSFRFVNKGGFLRRVCP